MLQIPLINADRLTLSILPAPKGNPPVLPAWAAALRDKDDRWQRLSQEGVQLFMGLIMAERMPFAFAITFQSSETDTVEDKALVATWLTKLESPMDAKDTPSRVDRTSNLAADQGQTHTRKLARLQSTLLGRRRA